MDYEITLHENWRPGDGRLLHPGHYRVPEDMSEEFAQRAIAEGGATRKAEPPKPPAPLNKARRAAPETKG